MSKALTKAAALAALQKLNYKISSDGYGNDFYDGAEYFFKKNEHSVEPVKLASSYYSWGPHKISDAQISFSTSSATYCCGIPEMGSFSCSGAKAKDVSPEEVAACIEYIKANEKTGYLRVTSTSQTKDGFWNKAFVLAGFKKRITLPSKHGHGRYKVHMWEWWDETKHKDA